MTIDLTSLADRIRAALATEPSTREVPMFGGLSFMVNDNMVVAAGRDGDLLVRVDPERSRELVARPGAAPAEMGSGRPMGSSWIRVNGRRSRPASNCPSGWRQRWSTTTAQAGPHDEHVRWIPTRAVTFFEGIRDDNSKDYWTANKTTWEWHSTRPRSGA